jgi:MoxR-like ATPase
VTIKAAFRPITVVTSNAEKELPDAFLRRCVFHYIEFPTPELMEEIVRVHFPDIRNNLLREAMKTFYTLRQLEDLRKKPSTSELIDWLRALIAAGIPSESISREIPFVGSLLKKETDYYYFIKRKATLAK